MIEWGRRFSFWSVYFGLVGTCLESWVDRWIDEWEARSRIRLRFVCGGFCLRLGGEVFFGRMICSGEGEEWARFLKLRIGRGEGAWRL